MTVENFPERRTAPDRSQQVLSLLSELSERLRRAEAERDVVKREILVLRDSIQDSDDRNSQTQKALLAFENKFDSTENTLDSALRRVAGMEEAVDKQSTEMLGILRKIEERFEAYDREYKNHVANIEQYGDTLDRFDKKLEKLMQDKGRISRKLDALEFQLADTEERLTGRTGNIVVRDTTEGVTIAPTAEHSGIQVWTPETAKPQFMRGPDDVPRPSFGHAIMMKWSGRVWQYLSVGLFIILLASLTFGVIYTLLQHPSTQTNNEDSVQELSTGEDDLGDTLTDQAKETVSAKPETKPETTPQAQSVPEVKSDLPVKDFFSKSVRMAIDQQIVAARKLEDDDTAQLMAMADSSPLNKRITRDGSLPRAIQAIEAKAFEGNIEAQHDMGALYSSGRTNVGVDYIRAGKWFRAAAEQGNANARYNLGVLYQQGLGLEKDVDQALSWYRSAALLEHPEARYNLGIAYVEGIGVGYNPAMAAGYFEQAARAGVIESAYNLGMILENGLIDEPRPFEAIFWYKLAADGGSLDGQSALFRLLATQGVKPDELQSLFDHMLAERPDMKVLAESRKMQSMNSQSEPPRVRIHTPGDKPVSAGNMARRINADANMAAEKDNGTDRIIRMVPPPAPAADVALARTAASTRVVDPQMVARIQSMLADEGFYSGVPDGLMGPGTANAIRQYQAKYGMVVDGKATTNLMAQMLARRLAVIAEPAAGEKTKEATKPMGIRTNE